MRTKALRTISLSAALCLGIGSGAAVFAQDSSAPPPPPMQDNGGGQDMGGMHHRPMMSPDQQLAHMTKALNLSSDQQTQIMPILQNRDQQGMQIRQDQSLARPDRMAKMQALMQDSNAKIEAVLNDAQKAKFEQMMQRRQAHMHRGGGDQGGPPDDGGAPPPDAQPQ